MTLMPSFRTTRFVLAALVTGAGSFFSSGVTLAAPPAAPTNVKVYTTRDVSGGAGNAFAWWHIAWDDNALDEAGYLVKGRYLVRGKPVTPYYVFAREAANTNYTFLSLNDQNPDVSMQFQVVAFKNNGGKMETRAATHPGSVRYDAGIAFNQPQDLTITRVTGTDGLYNLSWKDLSSTEIYHRLSYKKASESWANATEYQVSLFGENNILRAIPLKPGETYHFRLRAQRFGPTPVVSDYSNYMVVTTAPTLAAPSNLSILKLNDSTIQLNWKDNSHTAMGYELQYRHGSSSSFQSLTYTGGDDSSYVINIAPGANMEWRVRAVFEDNDANKTLYHSEFSNVASVQTTFVGTSPANVEAVTTGLVGSIAVRWSHDSGEAAQFEVLARPVSSGSGASYSTLATVPASTRETLISGLTTDLEMQVAVVAVNSGGGSSPVGSTAIVTPRDGFDSDMYTANLDPSEFGMVLLAPLREVPSVPAANDLDQDGVANGHDSHPDNRNLWCDWDGNGINDNEQAGLTDYDGDKVANNNDSHPHNPSLWCDWDNNGTNDNEHAVAVDTDGDGVADDNDSHPHDPSLWCDWDDSGTNDFEEAPAPSDDDDGDGVLNGNDSHPEDGGLWCDWNDNGTNDNEEGPIVDTDGDGVRDDNDSHPEDMHLWCDWNGNGTNDFEDPEIEDADGDNVANANDSHPDDASLWCDWNDNGYNDHLEAPPLTMMVANDVVRGALFQHELAISNEASRTSWTVTGLPAGFSSFNSADGKVAGTPSEAGIVQSPASVVYEIVQNEGTDDETTEVITAQAKLVFRVQQSATVPVAAEPIADRTIGTDSLSIPLQPAFRDPDVPRLARLTTSLGDVDIALTEDITPQAVANFLEYVNSGDYDGVAFHRSVAGFVVQAGGFVPSAAPNQFTTIEKRPSPRNEPGVANVRGTIAAAKVGSDPNSATHDFFLNLADNRSNLDVQNSGFTVFGRILGNGMDVVDAIAALPRGSYNVVIDGAAGKFDELPLNVPSPAPAAMDIDKTVKILSAEERSPFEFTLLDNSEESIVQAAIEGAQLVVTGLDEGTSILKVRATDYDGNHIDQEFSVTVENGLVHPSITGQPESQMVDPGSDVVFSVEAEGTGISYQWRKNGSPLPSQNGPTLTLSNVSPADAGAYDVVISNVVTTIISETAGLEITQEVAIDSDLSPRIVRAGEPLVLALGVSGNPEPAVAWFKNDEPLPVSGPVLRINAAALADHGFYRAEVTNSSGTQQSATISVAVVGGGAQRFVVKNGGKTSFEVATAAPPGVVLQYQWKNQSGANVPFSGRFSGSATPKLSIRDINLTEMGVYTCEVTGPGAMGKKSSGTFEVIVVSGNTPVVTAVSNLPDALVGQDYEYLIAVNSEKSRTPNAFTVSGLPRGLKVEKSTGRIYGRPVVAGTFRVRMRASNPIGASSTITADLRVIPMPASTTGTFVGMIERNTAVNELIGGRLDLSVTDNGAFSAKVILGSGNHSAKGQVTRTVQSINGTATTVITGSTLVKRGNLPELTLNFTINANNAGLSGDLRLDDTNKATLTGWKNFWHKTYQPVAEYGYNGTYHFGMTIPDDSVGDLEIPQGAGYGVLTVSASGLATVKGRTIDNKPVLSSAPLGPAGSFVIFQLLYNKTGSLLGPLGIAQQDGDQIGVVSHSEINNVTGFPLDQYKSTAQPGNTRDYKAGFTPAVDLTVRGGNYTASSAGARNAIARLSANGGLDSGFGSPIQANGALLVMLPQDGKILIGGLFSRYNNRGASGIARLHANGTLDETFNVDGTGSNGAVYDMALDADGKILVAGAFRQFNGQARNYIARLNADGTLDTSFDPGTGPNATVESVAVQADGKILIGGLFSTVAGTSKPGVARLTAAGGLDDSFNAESTATGVDAAVRRVVVQASDQKILIGGDFTTYNGTARNRIARLNADGTLDTAFVPGTGANSTVRAIRVQSDGKILIGGAFTTYNAVGRSGVARLTTTGAIDNSFNPGIGANGEVRAIEVRADGKIWVGGAFSRFDLNTDNSITDNRNGVALLAANGALDQVFVTASGSANNVRALLGVDSGKVLIGGWVWSAIRSDRILGLNDTVAKAVVDFSQAKVDLPDATNPDATFVINANNKATPFGANPAGTTWKFNAKTGIISGRAILRDASVARTIDYTALVVPVSSSDHRGMGVFDLPELPDGGTTLKTSPIHSGRIEVRPQP